MFWLDCGRQYSNLSTLTRLTVDSISCLEFHTCEQVDQTSATWGSLSLEAPKIRSATRFGAFQECEMCPRQASCLHQSLGSPKTCSSKLLTTWYLENRVVLQWQLYFVRLSWKRVNQLMSIFQLWSAHVSCIMYYAQFNESIHLAHTLSFLCPAILVWPDSLVQTDRQFLTFSNLSFGPQVIRWFLLECQFFKIITQPVNSEESFSDVLPWNFTPQIYWISSYSMQLQNYCRLRCPYIFTS